jgi:phospholipid/cholesterol/gamma-HCH transport system substrate-binding protein
MKETLNTVRVGLFFLVGVAIVWIVFETLRDGRIVAGDSYNIVAEFGDVKMLRGGDDVRVSGVRVGRVAETRLKNGKAEAVLEIRREIDIPHDSVATVAISSMLGTNFVSIEAGTPGGPVLAPGDRIATRHTADLNQIFSQLGELGDRIEGLFGGIGDAFAGLSGTPDQPGFVDSLNLILAENREALNTSLENIREITEKINRGDGTLARLLNDDQAYQSLTAAIDEIGRAAERASALTGDAGEILAHIRSGEGTIGSLIYGEELGDEIQAIAGNLRQLSDRLASGEGTLGRLLADDTLYRDIQAVIQKAERTIEGLGEQGPITAVGIAANALF